MIETNKIYCEDSLEYLKEVPEYEYDLMFGDPPYALGSELCIKDGKVDYKKAVDFMNKWEMPTGEFWEAWFKEAFRTLKHGGYCILFGMDRQTLLFKYYALNSGFVEQQSLYWYFISNFPKASDLSSNIDKHFCMEGLTEKLGRKPTKQEFDEAWKEFRSRTKRVRLGDKKAYPDNNNNWLGENNEAIPSNIPTTPLAKKYNGYKYSIAPLKQTCETVMIFQKPYKTKSCLHDVLAFENGDLTCCCGALDIDGNRSEIDKNDRHRHNEPSAKINYGKHGEGFLQQMPAKISGTDSGRYPAQTFITDETAEILDAQGETSKGYGIATNGNKKGEGSLFKQGGVNAMRYDMGGGGSSKILHKCNYEEADLLNYCPKTNGNCDIEKLKIGGERHLGCENFFWLNSEPIEKELWLKLRRENIDNKNNLDFKKHNIQWEDIHPTLKPIKLIEKILRLFKTPNEQKIYFPFAGSGSEIIGGCKAGFKDWQATEINQEYINIAQARIEHWTQQKQLF